MVKKVSHWDILDLLVQETVFKLNVYKHCVYIHNAIYIVIQYENPRSNSL